MRHLSRGPQDWAASQGPGVCPSVPRQVHQLMAETKTQMSTLQNTSAFGMIDSVHYDKLPIT